MRRAAGSRLHRARGRAGVALLVGGLVSLTGCATKKDVRTLQGELMAMQARQDSAMRVLQRENRMLLDSLRKAMEMTQNASGTTINRFVQLENTLDQTQVMVGQVMEVARTLTAKLDAFEAAGGARQGGAAPAAGGGTAEDYYALGTEKLGEGAYSTARAAFQQLLTEFRAHQLAPDAQFQIGETYAAEKNYEEAVAELEVVAQEWPDAERAPQALYRAGIIAADSLSPKQPRKARQLLQRVVDTYGSSPSAGPARTKLRSLPRS
jgi:tol-pal system protein YbgF